MMELRVRLVAAICCVFVTAAGCGSSDGGTGKDDDDDAPRAGTNSGAGTGNEPGNSAGSSSAGTGSGGTSNTSSGGRGGAPPGTAGNPGTGGSAPAAECLEDEPPLCVDASTLRVCFEGSYEPLSCNAVCDENYFEQGPCDTTENLCSCGDPINMECFEGAFTLCLCLLGDECTQLDFQQVYSACVEEFETAVQYSTCYRKHFSLDDMDVPVLDCDGAVMECGLPGEEMPMPMP